MEETLTDCLIRVREDLSQLKIVRDYLDTNAETEERCSITWRTIEAFNSILSVCSSENSTDTNALDTLLDSFYHLARNNNDNGVWDDFGFEFGIICVKVLSAIERSDIFEILFCKLLSVISIISEHNSNVWKSAGRQILNVLINKKVSFPYLEAILKLYIYILKNIESAALHDFSSQNLHLLKTLSLSVQKLGDFEIQSDVIELIFLHLSKDGKLMSDFFTAENSLKFTDFENDCRLYLNELNKPRRGAERKVYSICCHVLYLGGCFVEPPRGKSSIWVDANKDSERVTIKCGDVESREDRVIYIQFGEIAIVQLETDKTEGNRCVTIQTKNQNEGVNSDVCLIVENTEEMYQFVDFLKSAISEKKKKKKMEGKSSKTVEYLVIDRNKTRLEVQDNSITSSERPGIDAILPDVLSLFERANQSIDNAKTTRVTGPEVKTPPKKPGVVLESQELSPNSFVESLNRHIGLGSPDLRHSYEDSVETIEFLQKTTPGGHKLFRSPDKIINTSEELNSNFNFIFGDDKENHPNGEVSKPKIKTYKPAKPAGGNTRVLTERKPLEVKFSNSQSQEYFKGFLQKKKPTLPKLKRSKKSQNSKKIDEQKKQGPTQHEKKTDEKESEKKKKQPNQKGGSNEKNHMEHRYELRGKEGNQNQKEVASEKTKPPQQKMQSPRASKDKPSLLDPNGYAYRRWCQPTTSERSNFWLKKLTALEKPNSDSEGVFDFSDDSICEKKKKKRVFHSRQKSKTNSNQMTLQKAKDILKKSPVKVKLTPNKKTHTVKLQIPETPVQSKILLHPPQTNYARSPSPEAVEPTADENSECESISGDESPPHAKKRDRSDSSTSKRYTKKKQKTTLPRHLISTLRLRLRQTEKKDKQTTDEIIQAISKATDHLVNHIYRTNGRKIISYLTTAEAISTELSGETDELELRAKRIQRAVAYFKAGCSVSDTHEVLENQFSRLRISLKALKEMKDTAKVIDPGNDRLSMLLKSGIDELIKKEWESKRNRLLKCASILGTDWRGLDMSLPN